MLIAIMTSPTNGRYGVTIRRNEADTPRQDWGELSIYIPCKSYEHMVAVANAYNEEAK
jgi:hypothetical protein